MGVWDSRWLYAGFWWENVKKKSLGRPRHTESVCPVTAVLPKLTKDAAQLHRLS